MSQSERWIVDVGDADFEKEVLDASAVRPVVVDFWAPWCGPCRALAPILEALARELQGEFLLARVNIDEAQEVARLLGITSIPAVKGFRDGRLIAEFLGAQPEAEVRRFLTQVLPSEADRHAARGSEAYAAGDRGAAAAAFREALTLEAHHREAELGLARCLGDEGEIESALERVAHWVPGDLEAEKLAAELRLQTPPGSTDDAALAALAERFATDPDDHAARIDWARAQAGQGREEAALEALLASVERDPHWNADAARKLMLDLFASLGPDHPLTQRYRAALARVLYR